MEGRKEKDDMRTGTILLVLACVFLPFTPARAQDPTTTPVAPLEQPYCASSWQLCPGQVIVAENNGANYLFRTTDGDLEGTVPELAKLDVFTSINVDSGFYTWVACFQCDASWNQSDEGQPLFDLDLTPIFLSDENPIERFQGAPLLLSKTLYSQGYNLHRIFDGKVLTFTGSDWVEDGTLETASVGSDTWTCRDCQLDVRVALETGDLELAAQLLTTDGLFIPRGKQLITQPDVIFGFEMPLERHDSIPGYGFAYITSDDVEYQWDYTLDDHLSHFDPDWVIAGATTGLLNPISFWVGGDGQVEVTNR